MLQLLGFELSLNHVDPWSCRLFFIASFFLFPGLVAVVSVAVVVVGDARALRK